MCFSEQFMLHVLARVEEERLSDRYPLIVLWSHLSFLVKFTELRFAPRQVSTFSSQPATLCAWRESLNEQRGETSSEATLKLVQPNVWDIGSKSTPNRTWIISGNRTSSERMDQWRCAGKGRKQNLEMCVYVLQQNSQESQEQSLYLQIFIEMTRTTARSETRQTETSKSLMWISFQNRSVDSSNWCSHAAMAISEPSELVLVESFTSSRQLTECTFLLSWEWACTEKIKTYPEKEEAPKRKHQDTGTNTEVFTPTKKLWKDRACTNAWITLNLQLPSVAFQRWVGVAWAVLTPPRVSCLSLRSLIQ